MIQQPVVHDGKGARPMERNFARQHLVEHHAQRVDIAARIAPLRFHLLRRDIVRRPHGLRQFGKRQPPHPCAPGDPEIDELNVVLAIHHDVFRL